MRLLCALVRLNPLPLLAAATVAPMSANLAILPQPATHCANTPPAALPFSASSSLHVCYPSALLSTSPPRSCLDAINHRALFPRLQPDVVSVFEIPYDHAFERGD